MNRAEKRIMSYRNSNSQLGGYNNPSDSFNKYCGSMSVNEIKLANKLGRKGGKK